MCSCLGRLQDFFLLPVQLIFTFNQRSIGIKRCTTLLSTLFFSSSLVFIQSKWIHSTIRADFCHFSCKHEIYCLFFGVCVCRNVVLACYFRFFREFYSKLCKSNKISCDKLPGFTNDFRPFLYHLKWKCRTMYDMMVTFPESNDL